MTIISIDGMRVHYDELMECDVVQDCDDLYFGIPKMLNVMDAAIRWRETGCDDTELLDVLTCFTC